MLGLRFCARAFSSCDERGPLFIVVPGPLTIAASLVAEHRLQTRRLSSCGSWAQLLRSMWYLPRPGLEPLSPALAGGFLTTAPPGKPPSRFFTADLCSCCFPCQECPSSSPSAYFSASVPSLCSLLFSSSHFSFSLECLHTSGLQLSFWYKQ